MRLRSCPRLPERQSSAPSPGRNPSLWYGALRERSNPGSASASRKASPKARYCSAAWASERKGGSASAPRQLHIVGARLVQAQLAVHRQADVGGVLVFLAVILPPADGAQPQGAGRVEGFVSAAGATVRSSTAALT